MSTITDALEMKVWVASVQCFLSPHSMVRYSPVPSAFGKLGRGNWQGYQPHDSQIDALGAGDGIETDVMP